SSFPRDRPFDLARRGAPLQVLAAVVELLAACEGEGDLGVTAAEIQIERDQGVALLPQGADEATDLPTMQEEFPRPRGGRVPAAGRVVRADVHPEQPDLAALDAGKAPGTADLAGPDRVDLGSGEDEACPPALEDVVFVQRCCVPRHGLAPIPLRLLRPVPIRLHAGNVGTATAPGKRLDASK